MGKQVKISVNAKAKEKMYPSAELLQSACYEDYKRLIDTYDKIYEKINIALAFCGIVLLVILSNFDYTLIARLLNTSAKLELFSLLVLIGCSAVSAVCIVWAVIQLLLLMRSQAVTVFDSLAIRNEEIYRKSQEVASVWLIDKYTTVVSQLRSTITEKQEKYDAAVTKIVISVILFAVAQIVQKGA